MFKISFGYFITIILFVFTINFVSCVPTSVLQRTKETNIHRADSSSNEKVPELGSFHSSELNAGNQQQEKQPDNKLLSLSTGMESTATGQRQALNRNEEQAQILQKRGVNSQLAPAIQYGNDYYNPIRSHSSIIAAPNGIWADEIDPAIIYQDLQDLDEYPKGQYKYKPYENLQNMWNAETYSEPIAMPVQYPYRYYGDRKKRSSKLSKYDTRDTAKLTPADMLALVALVEAGERAHRDGDIDDTNTEFMKSYYPGYEYQPNNDETESDYNNAWLEPAVVDYYGMPYNLETIPKYEFSREPKFNRYPSKRYMIAKKKRSLGHFLNEPVASPSISFNPSANMDKDEVQARPNYF